MVLWDVEDPISSLWFANGLELWNNILMSKQNMLTKSIRHVMMEELLHKFLKVSVKVWHFFLRRYHCFLHWHGVTFLRRSCANYKTPRLLVLKEKMEKRWQTSHMHKTTGYAGERKVMQNTKNLKKKKKNLMILKTPYQNCESRPLLTISFYSSFLHILQQDLSTIHFRYTISSFSVLFHSENTVQQAKYLHHHMENMTASYRTSLGLILVFFSLIPLVRGSEMLLLFSRDKLRPILMEWFSQCYTTNQK